MNHPIDVIIVIIVLLIIAAIVYFILRDRSKKTGESCSSQQCSANNYCSSNNICEKGSGPKEGYGCNGTCILGLFCVRELCSRSATPTDRNVPSFNDKAITTTSNKVKLYFGISTGSGNESFWSTSDNGQRFSYSSSRNVLIRDSKVMTIDNNGLIMEGPASAIRFVTGANMRMLDMYGNSLQIGQNPITNIALFNAPEYVPVYEPQVTIEASISIEF